MEKITLKVNDQTIELPTLTLDLEEQMEAAPKAQGAREQATAMLEFLQAVIPAEPLAERLGGDTLGEIDIVALRVLFTQAMSAYQTPVINAQAKAANDKIKAVKPVLDVMTRQGFKNVK